MRSAPRLLSSAAQSRNTHLCTDDSFAELRGFGGNEPAQTAVNSRAAPSNQPEHAALQPDRFPKLASARTRMSSHDQLAAMPAWPILMNAATGALYLEIAPASFLGLVRRAGIRPVDLGLNVLRWRRSDLDALVTALPARGGGDIDEPTLASFDAALERSARRAAGGRASRGVR